MSDADAEDVDVSIEIDEDRTLVTVDGERAVALVLESTSGERIYLPPESAVEGDDRQGESAGADSPYDAAGPDATPYEGSATTPYDAADDSPYDAGRTAGRDVVGVQSTATGFRVLHPEPATDVRLLR